MGTEITSMKNLSAICLNFESIGIKCRVIHHYWHNLERPHLKGMPWLKMFKLSNSICHQTMSFTLFSRYVCHVKFKFLADFTTSLTHIYRNLAAQLTYLADMITMIMSNQQSRIGNITLGESLYLHFCMLITRQLLTIVHKQMKTTALILSNASTNLIGSTMYCNSDTHQLLLIHCHILIV